MSLFKLIKHTLILTVFAGFYGCGGTVVELMKEQIEQQLEDQYGLKLEKEEKKPKAIKAPLEAVFDSAKWEQNKLESAKRYAIWDNWRNQNYEYQYSDSELKIRLSFLFRSDYYVGEGAMGTADQASEFEIMIQNKTDSEFNLFLNNQDFKFLIDGKERTYGSFKYTFGETENGSFFNSGYGLHYYNQDLVNENSKELVNGGYYKKSATSSGNTPAEGIEFILRPFGTYGKPELGVPESYTGMTRKDLVILKFRHSQPLSEASIDRIFGSGKDILEEDIIPIRVDRVDTGWFHTVTILLNGKKYPLEMNPNWSGLPFSEDKALHDKIKLSPEAPSISNNPNWRGQGMYNGDFSIITLADLRRVALNGSSNISIGKEYNVSKLIERNGLYSQSIIKGSGNWFTEPFTGKVYYDFGEKSDLKKVYYGTLLYGKKDGFFTTWYENGQKESEGTYKGGEKDGFFDTWYENGQKESEGTYKNGKEDGLSTGWYENGQKKSKTITADRLSAGRVVKSTTWYENGQKKSEATTIDGERVGLSASWYEKGQKKSEGTYKDGKLVGLSFSWYESGKKESEGTGTEENGLSTYTSWYENGQKKSETTYDKDGYMITETYWDKEGNEIASPRTDHYR